MTAKTLLISIVLILSASQVDGQSIFGRIADESNSVLRGVQIYIPDLERGTVSNSEGEYRIDELPSGVVHFEFRFIGFQTVKESIRIDDADIELNVIMVESTLHAHEVLVEGDQVGLNYSTRSVTQIQGRELDFARGQSLASMIKDLPGVSVISTGPSIQKPAIRGLHSQRVTLINGGIAQEGQQWGGEHAPEIDPFSPQSIEVIRGAAGVEYGIGAVGGVIKVEPANLPERTTISGEVITNLFSNNKQAAGSIHLGSALASLPGLAWRAQTSFRKAGSARAPEDVIGNSGFQELDGAFDLGYHKDHFGLDFRASHFGTTLGLFRGAHFGNAADLERAIQRGSPSVDYAFSYDVETPKQRVDHDMISLDGHWDLDESSHIELVYGFQQNRRKEFDSHGTNSGSLNPAFRLTLNTNSLESKWVQLGAQYIRTAGLSYTNQANRNGESGQLIPNYRSQSFGIFARESRIINSWTFEGGGRFDYRHLGAWIDQGGGSRYERETKSWSNLTGILGVIRTFGTRFSLASTLSSGWRPPSVNELYNFGVHHGTAQFEIGNSNLNFERSLSLDLSGRVQTSFVHGEISIYRNRMNDFIQVLPSGVYRTTIRGTYPSFEYQQSDVVLQGLDGRVELHPSRDLAATADLSLLRATDSETGESLIFMPSDRIALGLEYQIPWLDRTYRSKLGLSMTWVAEQSRIPFGIDFSEPPPGYQLLDVQFSSDFKFLGDVASMSFKISNLLNTSYRDYLSRYRYFVDNPGRDIAFKISFPF